jgi:hypothetical protein
VALANECVPPALETIMAMWWEHSARPAEPKKPALRAVAYYRHSAQDRQENSVSIQQEQVRLFVHDESATATL